MTEALVIENKYGISFVAKLDKYDSLTHATLTTALVTELKIGQHTCSLAQEIWFTCSIICIPDMIYTHIPFWQNEIIV